MELNKLIKESEQTEWDFGNKILYDLCRENFKHDRIDKIIAKVWLIGRAYAVAIERRKNKAESNDIFYTKKIGPKLQNSKIDFYLEQIKSEKNITENNISNILQTHSYLTVLLKDLTDQNKRSFSSKYLHFHLPELFFIYDSRAVKSIGKLKIKIPEKFKNELNSNKIDFEYASFFYKCYILKTRIENEQNRVLTTRQIDNRLMEIDS